jgi:hypothetical protein
VPSTAPSLSDVDRDALTRAIDYERQHGNAERIEDKRRCEGFEDAGEFAAFSAQCDTLQLNPKADPDPNVAGYRPGEVALPDHLLAAGLSVFEPDPIAALHACGRRAV